MATTGTYLADRLVELGIRHYFAVPGDYSFSLLDQLLTNEALSLVSCSTELGAAYAADGYARTSGAGVVVTTFGVGSLSAVNAVAGAYAEDVPLLLVSAAPPSYVGAPSHHKHHSLNEPELDFVRNMFGQVTAAALAIESPTEAAERIDVAIDTLSRTSKPVYLEIAANRALAHCPDPFHRRPRRQRTSDPAVLAAAVEAARQLLDRASRPVLVGGARLKTVRAGEAFTELATSSRFATAMMPDARGVLDEDHPGYIGIFWGAISTPRRISSLVENADAHVYVLPTHAEYGTGGYESIKEYDHRITVDATRVTVSGRVFDQVDAVDFLRALARVVRPNDGAQQALVEVPQDPPPPRPPTPDGCVAVADVMAGVQDLITGETTLVVETGNLWFEAMHLALPHGARFEAQLRYASLGWSVGAALGIATASHGDRRVVALIGDGAFQMTGQELSTMLRYDLDPIIFVFNNGTYVMEEAFAHAVYNDLQNWRYADLVDVMRGDNDRAWGVRVATASELRAAVHRAKESDGLALIEVLTDPADRSPDLDEFVRILTSRPS